MGLDRRMFLKLCSFSFLGFIISSCEKTITGLEQDLEKSLLINNTEDTLLSFLQRYNPVYHEQIDWDFPNGDNCLLLIDLQEHGLGDYNYYINGQCVLEPINTVLFNPIRQSLRITRNNITVFRHYPKIKYNLQEA